MTLESKHIFYILLIRINKNQLAVHICAQTCSHSAQVWSGGRCAEHLTFTAVKCAATNYLTKEGMGKCVKELTAGLVYRAWMCQETICLCQIEIFLKRQLSPALKILCKHQKRKGVFSQPQLAPAVSLQHCSWSLKYSRNKNFFRSLNVSCSFHQNF